MKHFKKFLLVLNFGLVKQVFLSFQIWDVIALPPLKINLVLEICPVVTGEYEGTGFGLTILLRSLLLQYGHHVRS